MAIFTIIGQSGSNSEKLPAAIQTQFPSDSIKVQDTTWLVAWKGTAKELSDNLGITDGANGAAIVFGISTYYGRSNPNTWEWIKAKWESTGG